MRGLSKKLLVVLGLILLPVTAIESDKVVKPTLVESHVLYLEGEITAETVSLVQEAIEKAESAGASLLIDINSPGGSVFAEMKIVSLIRQTPVKITTYASGFAASAASTILSAGDIRLASPAAIVLTHYASTAIMGSFSVNAMETRMEIVKAIDKAGEETLASNLGLTVGQVRERFLKHGKDTIFTAQEAVEKGMVQGITDDPRDTKPDSYRMQK